MLYFAITAGAVAIVLFVFLLMEDVKNDKLLEENGRLKGREEVLEEMQSAVPVVSSLEERERMKKETPFTMDSIRTALRYNGCILGTDEGNDSIGFTKNDVRFCIFTTNAPILVLGLSYALHSEEEDLDSMRCAATDVMARTLTGKIMVSDDGSAVYFQAEYYCDSYVYFRDSLKYYLEILFQTRSRFFETYENMKEEKRRSLESLHNGSIFTSGELVPGPKNVS